MKSIGQFLKQYGWVIVLVVASVLRLFHLGDWSFSNDELSVLYRTSFDNFKDIIDLGIRTEGHPAGYHLFVWAWTALVGTSEFWVRLPFAIAGIAAVYLVFLVGREWFGEPVGLATSALMAILPFSILYSQLARPYSLGLFACWLALWGWTLLLQAQRPKSWAWVIYLLGATFATYFHYFSMFLVGLIGFVGLFQVSATRRKWYVLINLLVVLFYLPHVGVFLDQIAIGGLSEWLAPPNWSFPFEHAFYVLGESAVLCLLLIGSIIASALLKHKELPSIHSRYRKLALFFFFTPLVVGFCYSKWSAPILQHSTLYFSFPFGLMLLFSLIRPLLIRFPVYSFGTLLVLGSVVTIVEKGFYQTAHFGVFQEPAELLQAWENEFGKEDLTTAVNLNNRYYFDFYTEKPLTLALTQLNHGAELGDFARLVAASRSPLFAYGWSSRYNPYEANQIIRHYYPSAVVDTFWFNSGALLYRKQQGTLSSPYQYNNAFDGSADSNVWVGNGVYIENESNQLVELLEDQTQFSTAWQGTVSQLSKTPDSDTLRAMVWVQAKPGTDAQLVLSINRNGEALAWHSAPAKWYRLPNQTWWPVFISRVFPEGIQANDEVKLYVWNPNGERVLVHHFRVGVF